MEILQLDIVPLEASDPTAMADWHETYLAAQRHGRPHATPWMLEEMRTAFAADLEEIVESFARILGTLLTEAPTGDIERESEQFDAERIGADERVFADSGRTRFTTVALDPAGEVAAYTELVLPRHDPGRVYQWGTLARPQDRGRRLGLATKARNLRWAQPRLGRAALVTFNAEVNRHMIAVNERLGFRPVERLGEFQKRL